MLIAAAFPTPPRTSDVNCIKTIPSRTGPGRNKAFFFFWENILRHTRKQERLSNGPHDQLHEEKDGQNDLSTLAPAQGHVKVTRSFKLVKLFSSSSFALSFTVIGD